jgi:hypothetical protein
MPFKALVLYLLTHRSLELGTPIWFGLLRQASDVSTFLVCLYFYSMQWCKTATGRFFSKLPNRLRPCGQEEIR